MSIPSFGESQIFFPSSLLPLLAVAFSVKGDQTCTIQARMGVACRKGIMHMRPYRHVCLCVMHPRVCSLVQMSYSELVQERPRWPF